MRNRAYTLFCLLILIGSCQPTASESKSNSDLATAIETLVQPYLDSLQIAGIAIGISQNGDLLHQKAYGFADLNWKTPLSIEANFEIGSVTKQFTSVAILQLVDEGKLSLEDDFTKYIDYDTKGREVTIHHLLTHTSGIESYTDVEVFGEIAPFDFPRDTLLRMMEELPFDFEPGTALIYNNTGFYILGLVIEKISGQPYETYLAEKVFPLANLKNTYYCDESKVVPQKAYGYQMGKDGLQPAAYLDHQWPYAAGSLCSTIEDLLTWNQALHKDQKLLRPETYKKLIKATQLNSGAQTRYAKGLTIDELDGNQRIQHGGGIPGYLSMLHFYPEEDLSVAVLINTAGPVAPGKVANDIGRIILSEIPKGTKEFEGSMEAMIGTYQGVGRGSTYKVELSLVQNQLCAKPEFGQSDTLNFAGDYWSSTNDLRYYFKQEVDGVYNGLEVDLKSGYYILERVD